MNRISHDSHSSRRTRLTRRLTGWHPALTCAVIFLVAVASAPAFEPYKPVVADSLLDPAQWQQVRELDGRSPECMAEAIDGTMWFGVSQGLMSWDGVTWTTHGATEGLVDTPVTAILCTKTGGVYAGAASGIFRRDGPRWTPVFPVKATSNPFRVNRLIEAADGTVWAALDICFLRLGTDSVVAFAAPYRTKEVAAAFPTAKVVTLPVEVPTDHPDRQAIFQTKDGRIWLGFSHGVVLHADPQKQDLNNPDNWHVVTAAEGFHVGPRPTFCEAADGRLWIGNDQHDIGTNIYDPAQQKWTYFRFLDLLGTDDLVWSIISTRDGSVWVGGQSKLFRYRDGNWTVYRTTDAPISPSRNLLLEARNGYLWVLGVEANVQKIDPSGGRWIRYERLNFQADTPDGNQWFITHDDGVVRFDGESWQRYGAADGLIEVPNAVFATRGGQLWAAGSHHGKAATAWFDGTRWTLKVHEGYLPEFGIALDHRAIFEAADGGLWFACYVDTGLGGLLRYDPDRGSPASDDAWKNFREDPRLKTSYALGQLADGRMFSGSPWGLMEFDGYRWTRSELFRTRKIDAIAQTPGAKFLWIATRGQGLYQYDGQTLVQHGTKNGMLSDAVTALLYDRDQGLWTASSAGIDHFDGHEWTVMFKDEKIVMSNEDGGFRQSADGSLWINRLSREWLRRKLPGAHLTEAAMRDFGTIRYRPDRIKPKTTFTIALERVSQPGNTVVSWEGSVPWALSKKTDLKFSYRIDEAPWSPFTSETTHVFLQLPPGKRVIEVRAQDRDLNVETIPARLEFEVLPPVWQEPWFITLLAVLVSAVVAQTVRSVRSGHRLRQSNRQLESQKTQLQKEIDQRVRVEADNARTHQELLLASRQAGMAEVATSVLHNVGNVLNSVNVSASLVMTRLRTNDTTNLAKLADLLVLHAHEPDFLTVHPKGKQIATYLQLFNDRATTTRAALVEEVKSLIGNIDHIKEIVQMQQTYSRMTGLSETHPLVNLVEDAFRMNTASLDRHSVEFIRDFQVPGLTIEVEKHKLLQILVNLIGNAKNACDESGRPEKKITLRIRQLRPDRVQIQVIDTGTGIAPENMTRIFGQGFTTRKEGHGYGLHSSANAAKEMGGQLTVHSDGLGQGATFTVDLPLTPPK